MENNITLNHFMENNIMSVLLMNGISDHLSVFMNDDNRITYRTMRMVQYCRNELHKTKNVFDKEDVHTAYKRKYLNHYMTKNCPIKQYSRK